MGTMLTPKLYLSSQRRLWHWCPACRHMHQYKLETASEVLLPGQTSVPDKYPDSPSWSFNRNYTSPTLMPSMLIYVELPAADHTWDEWIVMKQQGKIDKIPMQRLTRCHYHIIDGMIVYCSDSPHELAGQTIPLPDLPDPNEYGYPRE